MMENVMDQLTVFATTYGLQIIGAILILIIGRIVAGIGRRIAQRMVISDGAENVDVDVLGALFIAAGGIDGVVSGTTNVDVTAGPLKAAIQTWPTADNCIRWTPAGGAFFRSLIRD